jgi:hypothetical protein
MDGVIGKVEDIYQEGGGVALDRSGDVHSLDRVRKLEEELDRLGQVFHLAGGRSRLGGSNEDELDRETSGKKVM